MSKIVYLMGKSSTGKDTVYKKLLSDSRLGLKTLVPYTTRPIRAGEQNGVEYFFTDDAGYRQLAESGKVVEERVYHTCLGDWHYFTVDDGQLSEEGNFIMIGTLESYNSMRRYYGRDKLIPVLIEIEDGERLSRALLREKGQKTPRYQEMCRRFLADCEDFSQEKITQAGITRMFINDDLDRCIEEIVEYIRECLV